VAVVDDREFGWCKKNSCGRIHAAVGIVAEDAIIISSSSRTCNARYRCNCIIMMICLSIATNFEILSIGMVQSIVIQLCCCWLLK
jgi:hypothetical protein